VVDTIDTWSNDIPAQAAELGGHIGDAIVEGMKSGDWAATFVGNLINDIGMALNGTSVEAEVPVTPQALIPTEAGQQMINDYNADIMALIEDGLPVSYAVQMMMEVQQGFTVLPQPVIDETWDTPETAEEIAAMMALGNPVSVWTGADIIPVNETDAAGFNLAIGGYMDGIVNGQIFGIDTAVEATPTLTNPLDVVYQVAGTIQAMNYDTTGASGISITAGLANGPAVVGAVVGDLQAQNYDTTAHAKMTMYVEINRVFSLLDAATGGAAPAGFNYDGTTDLDGDPATPMRAGGIVPRDNFPALLHAGEQVLTSGEVRSGGGVTINVYPSNLMGSRQEVVEWFREAAAEAGL
jgi:hypothetical protein